MSYREKSPVCLAISSNWRVSDIKHFHTIDFELVIKNGDQKVQELPDYRCECFMGGLVDYFMQNEISLQADTVLFKQLCDMNLNLVSFADSNSEHGLKFYEEKLDGLTSELQEEQSKRTELIKEKEVLEGK